MRSFAALQSPRQPWRRTTAGAGLRAEDAGFVMSAGSRRSPFVTVVRVTLAATAGALAPGAALADLGAPPATAMPDPSATAAAHAKCPAPCFKTFPRLLASRLKGP